MKILFIFNEYLFIITKVFKILLKKLRLYYIIVFVKQNNSKGVWIMLNKIQNGITQKFTIAKDNKAESKKILKEIYIALSEKGYDPINQIVGYLLSEDPTYITNYKNARALIRHIDRDELLNDLVKNYLGVK